MLTTKYTLAKGQNKNDICSTTIFMSHSFTNKLIHETSPYLLQHAHNPVQWYPWGEEALQKAKEENKVILVSIGYAACHWCHVMEKESFENEATAQIMNDNFINIKIDREERPDIDHIYMDAVQAMTGSGGWPLNVFLTPDAKPFYGGTYFPPVKAFNRSSWPEVLQGIKQAWLERKEEIITQAETLTGHLEKSNHFGQLLNNDSAIFTKEQCDTMFQNIMKNADTTWGGFGKAPKFPQTFTIQYLLQYHHFTGNEEALQQALLSIDKMLQGGIYDHTGGGFSRYSTDEEWLAPHFEKMLYDNALLLNILADAFQITKEKKYEYAIRHIIAFIQRELTDKQGGFYAALDADSEGEEGKFYVWEKEEVEKILGEDAALFCSYFDVTEKGNWEGKNILRQLQAPDVVAAENGLSLTDLEIKIKACLQKILLERNKRIRPITDDKILLGWNALMITALCKAAAALNEEAYRQLAQEGMQFLFQQFKKEDTGGYFHTYKNGIAKYPAFLDDYAYLVQACINLQEITSDTGYLEKAKEITEYVLQNFEDEATGYFFFTHKHQADVIVRKKEVYDGATPSGNSVMTENLFYLSIIFDKPAWQERAGQLTKSLSVAIEKYPASFGIWASNIAKQVFGINEIAILGQEFAPVRNELLMQYLPAKILQSGELPLQEFPLLAGKKQVPETQLYLCRQYSCRAPVKTVAELLSITG